MRIFITAITLVATAFVAGCGSRPAPKFVIQSEKTSLSIDATEKLFQERGFIADAADWTCVHHTKHVKLSGYVSTVRPAKVVCRKHSWLHWPFPEKVAFGDLPKQEKPSVATWSNNGLDT